jgi:hypothetical protein
MNTFALKQKPVQQTPPPVFTLPGRAHSGHGCEVNSPLNTQRTIGNQAIQRRLEANTRSFKEESTPEIGLSGYDFSRIPVHTTIPSGVQPMMETGIAEGHHGQADEREASNNRRAELLRQADATSGSPVEANVRHNLEQQLKIPLGNIRGSSGAGFPRCCGKHLGTCLHSGL